MTMIMVMVMLMMMMLMTMMTMMSARRWVGEEAAGLSISEKLRGSCLSENSEEFQKMGKTCDM